MDSMTPDVSCASFHQDKVIGQADLGELEHLEIEVVYRRGLTVFHVRENLPDETDHFIPLPRQQRPNSIARQGGGLVKGQ